MVTVLRIILSSILGGTFLGPTFFLSLVGGLAAVTAMALLYRAGTGPFSLVGISCFAAYAHILAVVLCVYFFFIRQGEFLHLLPIFFSLALVSGILTGTAANLLTQKLVEEEISLK